MSFKNITIQIANFKFELDEFSIIFFSQKKYDKLRVSEN